MSDILIRGVEVPEDGHWGTVSIPFYIHGDGSVSDSKGHIIGGAVHIPPHGRLIDADALIRDLEITEEDGDNGATLLMAVFLEVLKYAPTIIPAEEGKRDRH